MEKMKLVIVGGVAAGASAAAKARRCNEDAEIVMFEMGPDISYATCGLPYYLSGVIPERKNLLITTAEFFKNRFNVEVRTRHEVLRIDRQAQKVVVKNLATGDVAAEAYDRLILSTGATAILPPIPGVDLPFVFTLKTLEDTDRIHAFVKNKQPENAVVVGGGLIGIEAVENLEGEKTKVSVVEFMPQILSFLDREMAELVQQHLRHKGVDIYVSEKVTSLEEREGRGWIRTNAGRELPADLVIMSVGIRPNTKLAKDAGLRIGPSGGIAVNEFMGTDDPNIFAAGDCVESLNLVTGKPVLIPMGSAANKEGRAAGANAMGRSIAVKGFTGTVIVKVFDLAVAKTGLSEAEAVNEGLSPLVTYVLAGDHAGYYPDAKEVQIKTIADRSTRRLLGAQVIGEKGVDKRIDVMATAIYNRMALDDLLQLDLAYAPPFSAARDPVIIAGAVGQNFYVGDWVPITPAELRQKLDRGDDFLLVDTRTSLELKETGIIPGAVHIPIDDLRDAISDLDPERETVLYCAVGLRSYVGNRLLAMKDFKNVKTLTGGINSWTYQKEPFQR
ncbi:MAG: FAD-dependent oxidoreductase [Deltaproteobacteria bacterium]|jgi:NADPH-dependent 2,4-dienoyl-CoA reductase/sulfur reductase-like enzyme/rhodanese-related sulfurtransferase